MSQWNKYLHGAPQAQSKKDRVMACASCIRQTIFIFEELAFSVGMDEKMYAAVYDLLNSEIEKDSHRLKTYMDELEAEEDQNMKDYLERGI